MKRDNEFLGLLQFPSTIAGGSHSDKNQVSRQRNRILFSVYSNVDCGGRQMRFRKAGIPLGLSFILATECPSYAVDNCIQLVTNVPLFFC